jgi:hypothetical protein
MPPAIKVTQLFRDPFVVVARKGHPITGAPLTVEAYAACDHVLVSPRGNTSGALDRLLVDYGQRRRVALLVATYLAVPAALAASDLIATIPSRAATLIAAHAEIASCRSRSISPPQSQSPGTAAPPANPRKRGSESYWQRQRGNDWRAVGINRPIALVLLLPLRSTWMGARGNSANQIHHACLSSLNRIRVIPHLLNGELQTGDTVAAPPRCG